MRLVYIVVLVSALGCCTADVVILNQFVDQIIDCVKTFITLSEMDQLKIPDIDHDWLKSLHMVGLGGHAKCYNGSVGFLTSLTRTEDATLISDRNRAILNIQLGLSDLEFQFQSCHIDVAYLFSTSPQIVAKINSNSIKLQISLYHNNGQCSATFDHVKLTKLDALKINVTGSIIHGLEKQVMKWVTNYFHDNILDVINDKLAHIVAKANLNLPLNYPLNAICKKVFHE